MMQAVQQLFYPALTLEGGCQAYAEAYPQWYHDLVWSFDKSSATYVIYNTDGWMARKNIFVYSADGKLVHQGQWDQEWSYLLDLNKVSAGVYFVIMESGGDDFVRKIIIY
jgi:hypothetical protein